jgi:hypothetical protein
MSRPEETDDRDGAIASSACLNLPPSERQVGRSPQEKGLHTLDIFPWTEAHAAVFAAYP